MKHDRSGKIERGNILEAFEGFRHGRISFFQFGKVELNDERPNMTSTRVPKFFLKTLTFYDLGRWGFPQRNQLQKKMPINKFTTLLGICFPNLSNPLCWTQQNTSPQQPSRPPKPLIVDCLGQGFRDQGNLCLSWISMDWNYPELFVCFQGFMFYYGLF